MTDSTTAPPESPRYDAMMTAARRLLKERSFSDLTVSEVCDAAGVSRPTFYAYFRDKRQLLLQMFARISEEMFRVTSLQSERQRSDHEKIVIANDGLLSVWARHAAVLAEYVPLSLIDTEFHELRAHYLDAGERRIEAKIRRRMASGEIPKRDPAMLTQVLSSMVEGFCLRHYRKDGDEREWVAEFPDVLRTLSEAWYSAVYCTEPPSGYPYHLHTLTLASCQEGAG